MNVKDLLIAQVELTGLWENKLLKIETGHYSKDTFTSEINQFVKELIQSLKEIEYYFLKRKFWVLFPSVVVIY